jgi:hypothetical protein
MLIDIYVIKLKLINLYHNFEILIVGNFQNLITSIECHSKIKQSFKRLIKIKYRIKLEFNSLMNVPIQIKNS